MAILIQMVIGLIFGLGLAISGMIDPAKVLNFLDLAGTWDPSLTFVMAGAIAVTAMGYRIVLARPKPLLGSSFRLPTARRLDARIVVGPAIFGIGWGLSGLCPGPAIAGLLLGKAAVLVFVLAMLLGMIGARYLGSRQTAATKAEAMH